MNASTAAASTTQPRVTDVMPTEQELIDRARAMIPALKQRARQTTAQRRIPSAVTPMSSPCSRTRRRSMCGAMTIAS